MKEEVVCPKILVIIILFIVAQIVGTDNIFAQNGSKTGTIGNSVQTYEDPDIGLSFEHPSNWTVTKTGLVAVSGEDNNEAMQQYDDIAIYDIGEGIAFSVNAISLDLTSPPITTLKDFARYQYEAWHSADPPNIVNDNQTTVAGDHPALQMEYSFQGANSQRHGFKVWTIDNGIGYEFVYITDEGPEFFDNIPSIRKMLDSIEFIPVTPPPEETPPSKQPSFMDNN